MDDYGAPWTFGDVRRLVVATGAAAMVGVAAWFLASGTSTITAQIAYANLSVVGLIIAGYANAIWLLRGARAVGERRQRLLEDIDGGPSLGHRPTATHADNGGPLVAGEGLRFYHRPDCAMASGRDVRSADRPQHEAAGLRPCGVCRP